MNEFPKLNADITPVFGLEDDGIEPIVTISKQIIEEGKKEWKFTSGKYIVTAVYNKHLSQQAVKAANQTYNELFNKLISKRNREYRFLFFEIRNLEKYGIL